MGWFFHASDPMGGAAGEAFANTLASPGMETEHVLARESIQNSVDAGLPGAKVEVRFRSDSLMGARKAAFVEAAGLNDIALRVAGLELTGPNCLHTLEKPRSAIPLLYIEDYNAVGLSGNPHDKNSNFYRLLLSLGDRSKARAATGISGGSYGFGKSVYSSNSAIRTIFAYTRFAGVGGKETTRVFGCGYFISHDVGSKSFSGRAWLGAKPTHDADGRVVVDPLENAAADALATKLGFRLRAAGELGTSILVVDAAVDVAAIVEGVENWWWPRLEDGKLDVEIHAADGSVSYPKPKKNEALRPFIEAFEIANGRAAPKSGTQKHVPFLKEGGLAMGTCGFVVAPLTKDGNPAVPSERANSVALIRGPLMVVAYHVVSQSAPAVVGVYLAPDEDAVEKTLRQSEPPAHDRWDPKSTNLRDETGKNQRLVKSILSRIQNNLRKFQQDASPPTAAKQRRMTQLERALGGYFRPPGQGGTKTIDSLPSPLHLEFAKPAYAEATSEGQLRVKSSFSIRLDDTSELPEIPMRLRVNCPVMEDNEEGDYLGVTVQVEGVKATVDPADAWTYRFTLPKNVKAKFNVESDSYDPAWTVRLRPDFEREEAL